MLKYDGKEFRNLEEQVRKNQSDIEKIFNLKDISDLGIKIITAEPFANQSDLPLPYDGNYGDAFLVGEEAPYELYVWTRADNEYDGTWFDWGELNAPSVVPGPQGEQGEQGPAGQRGSLWESNNGAPAVSQNNKNGDQFLNTATGNVYEYQNGVWTITGNIQGPQGIQGIQGPKGDTGEQGIQGIQGPQGEPGQWIQIIDELANTDQLPDPDSVPRYYAYIIPVNSVKHLYVISGDETLVWLDCGAFTGPQGEQGPQGIQGIQGPAGVGITSIASGTTSQTADGYTQTPITFTKTDNSTSTLNVYSKNGATVTSITAGTPTSSGGYTTTPITFNYSDDTNQTVNVQAKEPTAPTVTKKYFHSIYCKIDTGSNRVGYFAIQLVSSSSSISNIYSWFQNHSQTYLPISGYYQTGSDSAYLIYGINYYNNALTIRYWGKNITGNGLSSVDVTSSQVSIIYDRTESLT